MFPLQTIWGQELATILVCMSIKSKHIGSAHRAVWPGHWSDKHHPFSEFNLEPVFKTLTIHDFYSNKIVMSHQYLNSQWYFSNRHISVLKVPSLASVASLTKCTACALPLKSVWTEYAFYIIKIFFGTEHWALVLHKKYIKWFYKIHIAYNGPRTGPKVALFAKSFTEFSFVFSRKGPTSVDTFVVWLARK